MTIEAGVTYISDLNSSYPTHTDPLSEFDSHIRNIKSSLLATFANVKGAVTASHGDLNSTTGLAGRVSTLESTALKNSGAQNLQGFFTTSGGVNAGTYLYQQGAVLVPRGVVVAYYGSLSAIPSGWVLCDGNNGTPDLRNRFILGAGDAYAVGQTGGTFLAASQTDSQGGHTHGGTQAAGGHNHAAYADVQGNHAHGGVTGSYSLALSDLPSIFGVTNQANSAGLASGGGPFFVSTQGNGYGHSHPIGADGSHTHNLSVSYVNDHSHAISTDGQHAHNVYTDIHPPYNALAFIMKT